MNHAIHGSPDVINRLQEIGKRVYFITNNSTKSRSGFLEKSHELGYKVSDESIISTSYAAAKYLEQRKFNKKVYLVGSNGIGQELDNVGIKHIGLGPDIITTTYHVTMNEKTHQTECANDSLFFFAGYVDEFQNGSRGWCCYCWF